VLDLARLGFEDSPNEAQPHQASPTAAPSADQQAPHRLWGLRRGELGICPLRRYMCFLKKPSTFSSRMVTVCLDCDPERSLNGGKAGVAWWNVRRVRLIRASPTSGARPLSPRRPPALGYHGGWQPSLPELLGECRAEERRTVSSHPYSTYVERPLATPGTRPVRGLRFRFFFTFSAYMLIRMTQ
jgi:hypothetical protein